MLDDFARAYVVERVKFLAGAFNLQPIVTQALRGTPNLELLDDDDLVSLHKKVERARECMDDGVPVEDLGYVEFDQGFG